MTLLTATLFFLVNCATSLSWARGRPDDIPEDANRVKVDRVVGGDTIVLMERTRVRLHGIEAPECDQPYGPMATTLYHSKRLRHQCVTGVRWLRLVVREVRARR